MRSMLSRRRASRFSRKRCRMPRSHARTCKQTLARIQRLCCLGIGGEMLMPDLMREVMWLVPSRHGQFCWAGSSRSRAILPVPNETFSSRSTGHAASRRKCGSCAHRPASPACGGARENARTPMSCSPRFTTGSPKASTPKTCRRPNFFLLSLDNCGTRPCLVLPEHFWASL